MSPGNGCEEFMTDWSVVCADGKLTAQCWKDVSPQINKLYINISSWGPGMCSPWQNISWLHKQFFLSSFLKKKNFCKLCTLIPHGRYVSCSRIFRVYGKIRAVQSRWHVLITALWKQVKPCRWIIFFFSSVGCMGCGWTQEACPLPLIRQPSPH